MVKRTLCVLLVAACAACVTESESDDDAVDGAALRDAAADSAAGGGSDAARLDSSLLDARLGDVVIDGDAAAVVPGDAALAESFRVTLESGACFGDCPVFTLTADSAQGVSFFGKLCTSRPGALETPLPEANRRAIAAALAESRFATLRDRYVDENDGCTSVATDHSGYTLTIRMGAVEKTIERYSGCRGATEAARVDALREALVAHTGAMPWLKAERHCSDRYIAMDFERGLQRLSRGDDEIGRLALHWPHGSKEFAGWNLSTCTEPLNGGRMIVEPNRRILIAHVDEPFTLPVLGRVGAIVLSRPVGAAEITAEALTNDGRVPLRLESASCP